MAQPIAIRRASIERQRARRLAEAATREPREIERRHLLGLAAMYQRIADEMAPEQRNIALLNGKVRAASMTATSAGCR